MNTTKDQELYAGAFYTLTQIFNSLYDEEAHELIDLGENLINTR